MALVTYNLKSDGSGDFASIDAALSFIITNLNSGGFPLQTDFLILLDDSFDDIRAGGYAGSSLEGVYPAGGALFNVTRADLDVTISIKGTISAPADRDDEDCEPTGPNSLPLFRIGDTRSVIDCPSLLRIVGLGPQSPDFSGRVDIELMNVLLFGRTSGTPNYILDGDESDFHIENVLTDGGGTLVRGGEGQVEIQDVHSIGGTPFDVLLDRGDSAYASRLTRDRYGIIVRRSRLGVVETNKPVFIVGNQAPNEGLDRYVEMATGIASTSRQAYVKIGNVVDRTHFPFASSASPVNPVMVIRDGGLYRWLRFDPNLDSRSDGEPFPAILIDNNGRRFVGIERCEFMNFDGPAIWLQGFLGETLIRDNVFRVNKAILDEAALYDATDHRENLLRACRNRWLGCDCVNGYFSKTVSPEICLG